MASIHELTSEQIHELNRFEYPATPDEIDERHNDLIQELHAHGVNVKATEVPEILKLGLDTFLSQRRIILKEKFLTTSRIICNEIRSSPYPQ